MELEYWSVIVKMGFGKLKTYVKNVGLELPKFATKGGLVKLIKAEGKYKEDELKDETLLPGSSPSTVEVMKAKTVQPAIAQKMKASSLRRRESAAKTDTEFRKTKCKSDMKAEKECKRFRRAMPGGGFAQDPARSLQNQVKFCSLSPEDFEEAVLGVNLCAFEAGFLEELCTHMLSINAVDWNNACSHEYDFPDDCKEQFQRWAKFIRIPNVRERIIGMAKIVEAQQGLKKAHEYSDLVHSALYEIAQKNEMIRYLTAILLFSRQKKVPSLKLWQMKNLETGAIGLLKSLMRAQNKFVTAQDVFDMQNWDKFKDEEKTKIRLKTMGGIMKEHFSGEEEETKEVESPSAVSQEDLKRPEVPLNKLMTELRGTRDITAANVTAETMAEKQKPKPPKTEEDIHRENLARIQFALPIGRIHQINLPVQQASSHALSNGLIDQTKICEELQESYNKLVLTSKSITNMWTQCERNYFSTHRTQFLKKIADPEFHVICTIVEDDWGFDMPDVIWGLIWEFRVPFTRSLDMRFAYEVFEDFEKNYPRYLYDKNGEKAEVFYRQH